MPGLGLGFGAEELGRAERRDGRKKRLEKRHLRAGGRRRGTVAENPDSVILYSSDHHSAANGNTGVRSAGNLFSSPCGSAVDRCSFGSDHDPFFSQLSALSKLLSFPGFTELEEDLLQAEENEEEESQDSSQHSFSHGLRKGKNRRTRSEAAHLPGRKPRRRRPASLDLNSQGSDAALLSPSIVVGSLGAGMKQSSAASSRSRSGTFPSPGTPNYRHGVGAAGYQKGWSSERVPLPVNSNRRYGGSGVLLPFNNGRTLPSKWEDAEKWIFSPISADGVGRPSVPPPHHRRPKSKSGPLGAPGSIHGVYASASPPVPCFDSQTVGNFAASSPYLAGVLIPERGCCGGGNDGRGGGDGGGRSYSASTDPYIMRSVSIHGWADAQIESSSSLPSSHGTAQGVASKFF
ncbi:hypothetical protein COCNU_scaffold004243G000020 [Cocos nucifera]|nr:hypothetical protein [Cocos nucifera]